MLYCASNNINVDDLAPLHNLMCGSDPNLNWFAVVDHAFYEGSPKLHHREASGYLYDSDRWKPLLAGSPEFIKLPTSNPATLQKLLEQLTRYARNLPMLSFLQSTQPLQQLLIQMRDVIEVETTDGQKYILRWADTRISHALPDALTPENWGLICRSLRSWFIFDRKGKLKELPIPTAQLHSIPPSPPMLLSDSELSKLLEYSEPDALINALSDQFPEILPTNNQASLFDEVVSICHLAFETSITGTPKKLALIIANRLLNGQLLTDQRVRIWLTQKNWIEDQFNDELGEFLEALTQ